MPLLIDLAVEGGRATAGGWLCPNRDEDITYALRLLQAGVSVELHQWSGTFHGSQAILSAEVSQRQIAELAAVLRRALAE
ncbi:alpha/beta hydrolase [Streptomyces decoyicus]|uniref:alpha/beta hydrolase n=1 Tax=Streptomyces decoyicus TaxID=249567 RepID=UPI003865D84D